MLYQLLILLIIIQYETLLTSVTQQLVCMDVYIYIYIYICILPPTTIELIFLKAIKKIKNKKFIDLKFKINLTSSKKLA